MKFATEQEQILRKAGEKEAGFISRRTLKIKKKKESAKTTWHEKHTSCTSLIHGWSLERTTNPLNQQAECHFIGKNWEQNGTKYILIILAIKNSASVW